VIEMLARWQLVARSSQDPQAHRRMLTHAAILNADGDIPRTPWEETKARLGLWVRKHEGTLRRFRDLVWNRWPLTEQRRPTLTSPTPTYMTSR
jgi:uncharacterized protein DUF6247